MSIPKNHYFNPTPEVASKPHTVRLRAGALDLELHRAFIPAFADIHHDPENECVILTGTGDTFLASFDEASWDRNGFRGPFRPEHGYDIFFQDQTKEPFALLNLDIPVIAAINDVVSTARVNDIVAGETADEIDVDDRTATTLALDLRRERLRHVEHTVHVDAHDAIADVRIDVGKRHDRVDTRVVDQHVDATELTRTRRDDVFR